VGEEVNPDLAAAAFLTTCIDRLVLQHDELSARLRADAKDHFAFRHLPLVAARIRALEAQRAALVSEA
jgi:hypothetical protein